jgi:glycosyltransferase involved in cell wall biosynthesis
VLLDAFAQMTGKLPARLWIAGDGPLAATLRARARALGIEQRVAFLGARHDVAELVLAADVLALASRREGLPMVVLEAMRAARPVVATDVGGTGEAVEHETSGLLVPPGDRGALAAALGRVLGDPVLAERLGAAGRVAWRRRFTARRMAAATAALYRDAAKRSPARPRAIDSQSPLQSADSLRSVLR